LRQSSPFAFIKTGEDFCSSQLFGSEHVPAPQSLELMVTLMFDRMLSMKAQLICLGLEPTRANRAASPIVGRQ